MTSAKPIDDLARRLSERLPADRLSRPGDPSYSETTTLWNGAVTSRPALAVRAPHGLNVAAGTAGAMGMAGLSLGAEAGTSVW
ncbi:hypothetical protein [Streptomyces sp. NPDC003717]|uniref:hypothetical protein n=1 Tax=Streptomyces sp. NPDC003717 TaxID=3154276 RepID=UPI0033B6A6BD